jgi:hypothetical protein
VRPYPSWKDSTYACSVRREAEIGDIRYFQTASERGSALGNGNRRSGTTPGADEPIGPGEYFIYSQRKEIVFERVISAREWADAL